MIQFNLVWLIILITNVISFSLMILFAFLYGKKNDKEFSFTSHFPFECYPTIMKIFSFIFVISLFATLGTILPFVGEIGLDSILLVVICFVISLTGVFMVISFYLPLKYTKEHLIISTLLIVGAFFSVALASARQFISFSMVKRFNEGGYHLALGIVGCVFVLIMCLVIFNPKLKNWALLEEHLLNDEKIYKRPKYFPLAYSEWISILMILVAQILFLTSLIE